MIGLGFVLSLDRAERACINSRPFICESFSLVTVRASVMTPHGHRPAISTTPPWSPSRDAGRPLVKQG